MTGDVPFNMTSFSPGKLPRVLTRAERAQNLVELALVVPLFLVLIMATIDFGWAFRGYITATNSAREGARMGITGASATDIKNKVVSSSAGLLDTTNVTVTNAQGISGSQITVAVAYDYRFISPIGAVVSFFSAGRLPDSLPISSSTTMRME